MWDPVLSPLFSLTRTARFQVIDLDGASAEDRPAPVRLMINWNCEYTREIIVAATLRRPWCQLEGDDSPDGVRGSDACSVVEVSDFENIVWEEVVANKRCASSYLVRKGLSRKAQLALQIRRYVAKHPASILASAVPESTIIETWNAFEDVKIDVGFGISTSFDIPVLRRAPLRERLAWTLGDLAETFATKAADEVYILKPSVTNKGADISLLASWDALLDALEESPDQREWVLQRYLPRPLLLRGHKFHLRVYVLCVGALRVFVFQDILMLVAAHRYTPHDLQNIYAHLTNTARAAELDHFDEQRFVRLLRDLPALLRAERGLSAAEAMQFERHVREQVHNIVAELFRAYENEYSVFCPMAHCFELFGVDFLVSEDGTVSLLEVNPGPDFVQTGDRLRSVIVQLWEQTLRIVVDSPVLRGGGDFADFDGDWRERRRHYARDFELVYSKEWSVSRLQGSGGMVLR